MHREPDEEIDISFIIQLLCACRAQVGRNLHDGHEICRYDHVVRLRPYCAGTGLYRIPCFCFSQLQRGKEEEQEEAGHLIASSSWPAENERPYYLSHPLVMPRNV